MEQDEVHRRTRFWQSLMPEAFIQDRIDQRIIFGVVDRSSGRRTDRLADFIDVESRFIGRFNAEMIELKGQLYTKEGSADIGALSKFYISSLAFSKHREVFKTVFDLERSPNPRLITKLDCRLSQFRFVVRGVWKIQDFSVTYPHYVIDCQSEISLVQSGTLKNCNLPEANVGFSKLPLYYNLSYKNLVIFTDKKTGSPMFGKIIELSSNFAFCEVLMPWGIVHLVSSKVNQLKRLVATSNDLSKPGWGMILTNLRYWNKRIRGTETYYLKNLRTKTTVYQVLEISSSTEVESVPQNWPVKSLSFCSYPDEALEKISRSETLLQLVRDELSALQNPNSR